MIVYSATELAKAGHKYTRKWRGKDGQWNYEYSRMSGKSSTRRKQMEGIFGEQHANAMSGGGGGTMQLREGDASYEDADYSDYSPEQAEAEKDRLRSVYEVSKVLNAKYPTAEHGDIAFYKETRFKKYGDTWHFEPKSDEPLELRQNDVSYSSASQVMRDTAMAYKDTVPSSFKITAKIRNRLNKVIRTEFPGDYYDGIPLSEINAALKTEGFVLLQEDNTEWAGMLMGENSEAFFNMGDLSSGRMVNGMMMYAMVENSGLRMTWYKMNSNKYEVIKYIT